MTQEEKELLLKDLCARLPYRLKVNETVQGDFTLIGVVNDRVLTDCDEEYKHNNFPAEIIRPYLRPMSSMTEEEILELYKRLGFYYLFSPDNVTEEWRIFKDAIKNNGLFLPYGIWNDDLEKGIDWLNKNMFDYRGLIPKGIALEAKEGMYKFELL